jgi:hypothetical protein
MRSQVWAAQAALYDDLKAATFPGRLQVALGVPGRMETDIVWVSGEVDDWRAEYRTSGLAAKDEEFDLRVHVFVSRMGTYADAVARLRALGEVVEDTVHADYTLGGTVMLAKITRSQLEESVSEDGRARGVLLTLWVRCAAHVVPAPPPPNP